MNLFLDRRGLVEMLNKQKGNMYGFVSHTWNTLLGRCSHKCKYCYNLGKPFFEGELRLNEKNLKDNLGENNFIFVGSSNDLFADTVPKEWIIRTLEHCQKYPKNKYLFQTKNPKRFENVREYFPDNSIYCITLETNKKIDVSKAPPPSRRFNDIMVWQTYDFVNDIMITIEPIMDFNLKLFINIIKQINPKWVNIGADSKNHNLPEPSPEKVKQLIEELKRFTEVKIKDNLKRLMG